MSEFDQTKRRHHRPYTVDEGDALGLAITLPQGAMGAVGHHGCGSERSPKLGGGDFRTAVRCDTWYYSTYRTVETERTSENPVQSGTITRVILVKLELWESVMVIKSFGLPLTYAYATLRQSVAGNSTFWGIVFFQFRYP